ncbi:methyltransferas-like protein [Mytilinidion resinicola]|uniref:carnosine N-methyltransferase n=1 Tax=Mytilinidion resinicola TaxID=574789 RepID=A0A6A6Z605_9PEZI|nr:methyltransferas-like protein [Mytilinidion resinicola]KAF2815645.1 methyltransferas-like protein [Mytilinidion resinicola]
MAAAGEWHGEYDPLEDPEEQRHILSILDSFRSYRRLAHHHGTHTRRQAFYALPSAHWTLLAAPPFNILSSLDQLDTLVDANADLADAIFITGFRAFVGPHLPPSLVASVIESKRLDPSDDLAICSALLDELDAKATPTDCDKARSCINQFYRDWSAAGSVERDACFSPVISALVAEFTNNKPDLNDVQVLVPGAGLARLVFDLVRAGFTVEGNEISYHELMASSLVLNHTTRAGEYTIAPFALGGSNHHSRADQFQTFAVPDVLPRAVLADAGSGSRVHASERMSMCSGDFCVLYGPGEDGQGGEQGRFDAVATVFFVDTAPNVVRYVEAVRHCLREGGVWVNLGPLLWHHVAKGPAESREGGAGVRERDMDRGVAEPGAVELTDEEMVKLVECFGFKVERQETGMVESGYMQNPRSMLVNTYRPSFWVARKVSDA